MVNPIALSYAKLKQFHNNPQYNQGMEAVYNRAMSAPVAPNVGGEIIRNILGAYVGSKLGEGKQNYMAAQQEQERQRRLMDERSMLDYRVGLEDKQKEAERERLYQGLLGMGSPESFSPTGEQWASPAPVKGVPAGLTADTYSKMAERKLLPEKQKSAYEVGQVLSPIDVGDETITYRVTGIDSNNIPILSVIGRGPRYKPAQPAKPEKDTTDKDFSSWMKLLSDAEFGGGDTEGITNYIKNKFPAEWGKTQARPEVINADTLPAAETKGNGFWKDLFGGGDTATTSQAATTSVTPEQQAARDLLNKRQSKTTTPQPTAQVQPTVLPAKKRETLNEQVEVYTPKGKSVTEMNARVPIGSQFVKTVKTGRVGQLGEAQYEEHWVTLKGIDEKGNPIYKDTGNKVIRKKGN